MCDWLAAHWHEWLSRPEWWQTVSAVIQATFAVFIFFVTQRYVKLTNKLVRATIDPVIEFELADEHQGYSPSFAWTIRNIGVEDVQNWVAECRLFSQSKYRDEPPQQVVGKNAVKILKWPRIARDGGQEQLPFYECVEAAGVSEQERERAEPQLTWRYTIDFFFRYQRVL